MVVEPLTLGVIMGVLFLLCAVSLFYNKRLKNYENKIKELEGIIDSLKSQ